MTNTDPERRHFTRFRFLYTLVAKRNPKIHLALAKYAKDFFRNIPNAFGSILGLKPRFPNIGRFHEGLTRVPVGYLAERDSAHTA